MKILTIQNKFMNINTSFKGQGQKPEKEIIDERFNIIEPKEKRQYSGVVQDVIRQLTKGGSGQDAVSTSPINELFSDDFVLGSINDKPLDQSFSELINDYEKLEASNSPLLKNGKAMIEFINKLIDLGNLAYGKEDLMTAKDCFIAADTLGRCFNIKKVTDIKAAFFQNIGNFLKSLS